MARLLHYQILVSQDSLWRLDEYLLVAVIYDCSMIDRNILACGKSASLELSLGNAGNLSYSDHQVRVCDEEAQENGDSSGAEEETTCEYTETRRGRHSEGHFRLAGFTRD